MHFRTTIKTLKWADLSRMDAGWKTCRGMAIGVRCLLPGATVVPVAAKVLARGIILDLLTAPPMKGTCVTYWDHGEIGLSILSASRYLTTLRLAKLVRAFIV